MKPSLQFRLSQHLTLTPQLQQSIRLLQLSTVELNQEIVRVLNSPEVRERFFKAGVEVVASSPDEFAALMKAETNRWGKLIREAGIRVE